MKIYIQKNTAIHEINEAFSEAFPGLRLGFFLDKNKDSILTADEEIKNGTMTIGALWEKEFSGEIEVLPEMTVEQVEKLFKDSLSVEIQLFRQSGKNWLRTIQTDSWTLAEQQKVALESIKELEDVDKEFNFRDQQDIE